jgi:hypothetical protein
MAIVDIGTLTARFPSEAVKEFKGRGGKFFSYLGGETVIKRLNDATENHWDLSVEAIWSDTMPGGQTVMFARVKLTLPDLGSREHIGVQVIGEKDGEDMYKGAITDALKKAATLFGVGLELYDDPTPARRMEPQERQAVDAQHERNVTPPRSNISAVRNRPPDAPQPPMQDGTPKGLYYEIEGGYHVPPDVSQLHGITKMDPLNTYLRSNGFDGGMKGEVITELSQTFGVEIKSGRGKNQYGDPDVFPGELYNLAYEHITTPEPPADGAPTEAFDEVPF